MSKNITTIQNIYAAFGRGDVPAILENLTEDCTWEYGCAPNNVPWLQTRKGRTGAAQFFQTLGQELDVKTFNVTALAEAGNLVIAVLEIECVVKRTGKTVHETDEVHLWHFDDKGRVTKYRHCVDTLQHARALEP